MWEMFSASDVPEQKRPIIFESRFQRALISIIDHLHVLYDTSIAKIRMNRIEKLPK